MKLISFSPTTELEIRAKVEHRGQTLAFWYEWLGPVLDLGEAPGDQSWTRGDELWKTTCFEAFWSEPNSKIYWELNVSPLNKQWNLYRFDDYRLPQPPASVNEFDLSKVTRGYNTLSFELSGPRPWPNLEVAPCAVIRQAEGLHHFAIHHRGPAADFHRRTSFTYALTPKNP